MPFFSFGFDGWPLVAKFTSTKSVDSTIAAAEDSVSILLAL